MKPLTAAIILVIVLTALGGKVFAQEKIDVDFEADEGKVLIHYFLHGDPEKDYLITTQLRKTSDPTFRLIPKGTSGDIGTGKFAARKCTITWNIDKSQQEMLSGEDFYFEVTAQEIKQGSSWYWYAIGAAVLGGGAATYLLLSKDKQNGGSTSDNLAAPPGRP
ncbi:MAG: hypothetical protein ACM34K_07950 [Bacillota bacterium]